MQAMISPDFLIMPAFASGDKLSKSIEDIISINKFANHDYDISILLPTDSIERLVKFDLYPCEKNI